MVKHSSTTQLVEGKSQKRTRFWHAVRNVLTVCGVFAVVLTPIAIANALGIGQSPDEEEQYQESQLSETDPFGLEPGLAIVEMTHQGKGDFVVNLLSAEREETTATPEPIEFFGDGSGSEDTGVALALTDGEGSADVSRAVNIPTKGKHIFDVKADGPWTIEVEQPRPSDAPPPTKFSGDDDTATPLFQLSSGLKKIVVTNPVAEDLQVSLLDKDGNEVDRIFEAKTDQPGQNVPITVSGTIDVREAGIYLFDIQADSLWTIEISDAE
jgi:hypothetical protein